jgi:hypothetical protein
MRRRRKRSRLTLLGVVALALSMTLGLASGSVAEAKKGKGKGKTVTVAGAAATIPAGSATANSLTSIPFTVGKKAKGKVVGHNTVLPTIGLSGPAGFLPGLDLELVSPLGRPVDLEVPGDAMTTAFGPITYSPNSFAFFCAAVSCPNPKASIHRPYTGIVSDVGLALFSGIAARGTWHLLIVNPHPFAIALTLASLQIDLEDLP